MADFLVVGGGIAGASVAYFLSQVGRVMVLDMEDAPGRHATGRSAALFTEYYGNVVVRALTRASRSFFLDPPSEFADRALVTPRGTVALCPPGAEDVFDTVLAAGQDAPEPAWELTRAQALEYCPVIRPEWFSRAMLKPATMDIDVDAVHQGFLRGVRAGGGRIVLRARVRGLDRRGGRWHARTDAGEFSAPILVNAAGAWADEVADLAGVPRIGLTPLRRTVFLTDPPPGLDVRGWPMVNDVTETFYLKPESGRLLVSPADATLVPPGDARPDDLDIARGAARVEEATTLRIRNVKPSAGLRSFVAGGSPVVGAAPGADGFFWLAALGGYGMQMSPALGQTAAAVVRGDRASHMSSVLSQLTPQ